MTLPKDQTVKAGDPLYVPREQVASALSLGAVLVEGDARLFVPRILPTTIGPEAFSRWRGEAAKLMWIGEFLEEILSKEIDLEEIAGMLRVDQRVDRRNSDFVQLFVPRDCMDRARQFPGVHWDKSRRTYVADRTADFSLIHEFLTPSMKARWVAERNVDSALTALVRARAMIEEQETGEGRLNERAAQEVAPSDPD